MFTFDFVFWISFCKNSVTIITIINVSHLLVIVVVFYKCMHCIMNQKSISNSKNFVFPSGLHRFPIKYIIITIKCKNIFINSINRCEMAESLNSFYVIDIIVNHHVSCVRNERWRRTLVKFHIYLPDYIGMSQCKKKKTMKIRLVKNSNENLYK